ncbi:hypothetical protein KIW84_033914 [Lathyrus oleraceus]|uniref:Uncharacterized protein n=1 Tax=Pisum sativum TaxID=3888 RepID=A0A9D5B4F9_PEA|nr:hypothetical protein KIW84_033914 [Pisum sativum]
MIDNLIARLEIIPSTPLSITVSSPVVSDTIPATIPITTMVTAAATTDFDMSSEFAYSFGHPYGPPHGFLGLIPPPKFSLGFPTGPFGPYGPQPLFLSRSLRNTMVSGKKNNDEVYVIVHIFNKPKAFEIFFPPKESTPPNDSTKCLNIKIPAHFPYKSNKVVPCGYEPTTIVNSVEKSLVNNKVVTNIADARSLARNGRVFTPANLRGGKSVVEKPDNGKAPLVILESRPIQDVEAEEILRLIQKK